MILKIKVVKIIMIEKLTVIQNLKIILTLKISNNKEMNKPVINKTIIKNNF